MDDKGNDIIKPVLKKVLGWIPFGETEVSPLLELNFRISGALIDANALLRKNGWRNATELNLVSNDDGYPDKDEATEEKVEDSCWLRWEFGDYAFALALSYTMIGSKAGKFQLVRGKRLYDTHNDLSRQRLCWVRWLWGWKRNPATGEYGVLDSAIPAWVIDRIGLDDAIVEPPDSLEAAIRFQTQGYSMPIRRTGEKERMLAVYAAIAESASPPNASHAASLFRFLVPFAKAIHGFDPDGLKWIEETNCPETYMQMALLAHRRGFPEAGDALLWCALKDVGSPSEIPFEQSWDEIDKLSTATGNHDFHMMWTNEILRNRVLLFPQDFGETLTRIRGIVRQCCLCWLDKGTAVGDAKAIAVFLELIGNAKRLPPVPHCDQLGDDEFDALARLGRRLHEKAHGERFGAAYREALERAAEPSANVLARLRDLSVFDAFVHDAEQELLESFPNPRPVRARAGGLPEKAPKEGMTHVELWRWLGCDEAGRPLFTEEDAARVFAALQPPSYSAPKGKRPRVFVPEGGEVEVFGIDTKRKSFGVTFIRTRDPLAGEVIRAIPQIPLATAVDHIEWARLESWIPWADESCAYMAVTPVLGGRMNAVFATFACDWRYPEATSLYKTTFGFFADSVEECVEDGRGSPVEPMPDAKWAWREDVGTVAGDTVPFVIGELGAMAAVTSVEFTKFPFAVPLYHQSGIRLSKGMRIRARGWIMADAEVNHPARNIYAAFNHGI